MSGEKNFDDFIKKEFNNYSPDVAPHIWDKIAAAREERKPKAFWLTFFSGRNLFWMAASLVAFLIGAGLIVYNYSSHDVAGNNADKNNPVSSTTNNSSVSKINLPADKKEDNSLVINPTKNNKNTNVGKIDNNNITSSAPPPAKTSDNKIIAAPLGKNKDDINNNESNNDPLISKSSSDKFIVKQHSIISHRKLKFYSSKLKSSETSADENTEDVVTGGNYNYMQPFVKSAASNNNNYLSGKLSSGVEKIDLDRSITASSLKEKNTPAFNLPECPSIEKNAAGNKRYLEIYIAPDYALRSITDTANSVYLQKRSASTQFSSAFSAGIRYTKVFDNCMSVRAAINYSQINEKFSYVQGNVIQTTYIINAAGDTTGSYTVRGTRYKTTYNHYHSIDIPLTVGYELGNGRFHANINAGVIANIYSWQKGDVLDTNLNPVDITTGKGSSIYQFKTNVGLGLTGGASFYYKLTEQLHFLAEPYIRYNLEPMSSDKLTLRQKYTTIGLRLGLRFDIPKAGSIIQR